MSIAFFTLQPTCFLCLIVGSNTTPSRQSIVTFPRADTDNTMLGFAYFENGFRLQSHLTTCTYNDFFPIGSTVDLRGGRLYLLKDLFFDKSLNITSSGSIFANQYSIEFDQQAGDLVISPSLTFDNVAIFFNTDVRLHAPMQFRGACKINANGKFLTLCGNSAIVLRPGTSLVLEDVMLYGLSGNNLRCMTDNGALTIHNSILSMSGDYTFSRGSILFEKDVAITGTTRFIYGSGLTSTIASLAKLFLEQDLTFSYAPRRANGDLLYFTDATATLHFNGCSLFSTRTGLQFTTGTLIFDDKVTVSSQARNAAEAIKLGSNVNIIVKGGATLDLYGLVRYE